MLQLEAQLRGGELCEERGALLVQRAQLGQTRERVLPSAAAGAVGSGGRCRSSHSLSLSRRRCSPRAPVLSFPFLFAFGGGSHCGQLLVQVRDGVLVSTRKRTSTLCRDYVHESTEVFDLYMYEYVSTHSALMASGFGFGFGFEFSSRMTASDGVLLLRSLGAPGERIALPVKSRSSRALGCCCSCSEAGGVR